MRGRHEKIRGQYLIDSKQTTAKKSKKCNESFTPNSLSTSHNYQKYQKYDEIVKNQKQKQFIGITQLKAFIRSLRQYCKVDNSASTSQKQKKSEMTAKLFQYFYEKFQVIGKQQQICKVKQLINELVIQRERLCERCDNSNKNNGPKCSQLHKKYLNDFLPEDIQTLQKRLQVLYEQNQRYKQMIQNKRQHKNSQNSLKQLKQIIKYQQKLIKQLEQNSTTDLSIRKPSRKSRLQIFIEDEQK